MCPQTYLHLRCCGLPRHLNCPFTMMATRLHRDSHSSMLKQNMLCHVTETNSRLMVYNPFLPSNTTIRVSPKICHIRHVFAGLPVRRQNNRASLFHNTSNDIPQETPSFWIHTSGRLVLKLRQGLLEKRNQLTKGLYFFAEHFLVRPFKCQWQRS